MHRPTVHKVCQKYNLMFKTVPRALFITLEDRGRVFRCGLWKRAGSVELCGDAVPGV